MGSDSGGSCDFGENGLGRQVGGVDLGPGVDYREDLRGLKVCEGQVVCRSKGNDIAFASHRLSA